MVMVMDSTLYSFDIGTDSASYQDRFKLVINPDEVEISRQGIDTLWSNYADGNKWFFRGQLIQGENKNFLVIDEPGIYGLEVSNLQCSQNKKIEILATDLLEHPPAFITYPNPVTDYLILDFAAITERNTELYVYDMTGKLHFSKSLETSLKRTEKVNFAKMVPGIYLAKMIVDNKSYSLKIIKSP